VGGGDGLAQTRCRDSPRGGVDETKPTPTGARRARTLTSRAARRLARSPTALERIPRRPDDVEHPVDPVQPAAACSGGPRCPTGLVARRTTPTTPPRRRSPSRPSRWRRVRSGQVSNPVHDQRGIVSPSGTCSGDSG
jgi:hypothetical protein